MLCEHSMFSLMFMKKGMRLRSQTEEAVVNVYDYFEEVNRHKKPLMDLDCFIVALIAKENTSVHIGVTCMMM